MMKNIDFKFRINASNDYYIAKTDATACLSRVGAKAIGKAKMAFREYDLTVDQFLQGATSGYAFCNLFEFDPNQKYLFETCDGRRYQTTPLYMNGPNKGCMKMEFKCDRFFSGAQTVFVDIDLTRFESIPDYLACLTIPPTCAYMSYSDGLEKRGVVSRRFRLVYVFDRVLGKDDLKVVSRCITDSIVQDTGEPMEDDCGERPSQYFNGVYGNEECYASYRIYSRLEFPESLPEIDESQVVTAANDPTKPSVVFDEQLLHDMGTMGYEMFMHYYSTRYRYYYRTETNNWINGTYQLTDENYLQLWWHREKITDGNHRRRTLFKRACLRRLINPYVDADTLLFNMYVDLNKFIDYSDHVITMDMLKRRVERAMQMDWDELQEYCEYEIAYWKDNRQKFILHPNAPHTQAFIRSVTKEVHFAELDGRYDRSKTVMENLAMLDGEKRSTLYRYCSERGIPTNPGKTMTEAQRRENNRQAKADDKAQFMMLYDPNLSALKNKVNMKLNGLDISESTVRNWRKEYIKPDLLTQPEPWPQQQSNNDFNLELTPLKAEPHFDTNNDFNWQAPRVHVPESLTRFGQGERENYPNYTEGKKIWNKLYD